MGTRLTFRRHSTVSIVTLTANPVLVAEQGTAATSFTLGANGGTPPYLFSNPSGPLPTGMTINSSTGVVGGTPSVNGVFPAILLRVTDSTTPTAQHADLPVYTLTVAAAPAGINVANQAFYFGSLTPAGKGAMSPSNYPTPPNQVVANCVINSGNGAGYWQVSATGDFTPTATAVAAGHATLLAASPFTLGCTYTGTDATTDPATITINIETRAGRSVATPAELVTAISAWTTGTDIRLRPGNYGDSPTISNKAFAAASYFTKHTGQTARPIFRYMFGSGNSNIWYTFLEFGNTNAATGSPITSNAFSFNNATNVHVEDCVIRGTYTDRFQDFDGSSALLTRAGTGIGSKNTSTNVYVKRNYFIDLWIGLNFSVSAVNGAVEVWDNYFSTYATSMTISKGATQTSLTILRNYLTGWTAGLLLLPAKSHSDGIALFQGSGEWESLEVSQNTLAITGEGPKGCKGIFLGGSRPLVKNVKILDNLILCSGINGITLQDGSVPCMTGTNNVIAGNTLADHITGLSGSSPSLFAFNGLPGTIVKLYGNILPLAYGSTMAAGGTIVKGTAGADTNVTTGYNFSASGMSMAEVFNGPFSTTFPANRAEVLSKYAQKTSGPADIKNAGAIGGGHSVMPTNELDPTGASQVDTTGEFWE